MNLNLNKDRQQKVLDWFEENEKFNYNFSESYNSLHSVSEPILNNFSKSSIQIKINGQKQSNNCNVYNSNQTDCGKFLAQQSSVHRSFERPYSPSSFLSDFSDLSEEFNLKHLKKFKFENNLSNIDDWNLNEVNFNNSSLQSFSSNQLVNKSYSSKSFLSNSSNSDEELKQLKKDRNAQNIFANDILPSRSVSEPALNNLFKPSIQDKINRQKKLINCKRHNLNQANILAQQSATYQILEIPYSPSSSLSDLSNLTEDFILIFSKKDQNVQNISENDSLLSRSFSEPILNNFSKLPLPAKINHQNLLMDCYNYYILKRFKNYLKVQTLFHQTLKRSFSSNSLLSTFGKKKK